MKKEVKSATKPKPVSKEGAAPAKGDKRGLAGKPFAEQEAALRPGGAADKKREPQSKSSSGSISFDPEIAQADSIDIESVEYYMLSDGADAKGIQLPALGAWMKLPEPEKQRYRDEIESTGEGGGQMDQDYVEYEFFRDAAEAKGLKPPELAAWMELAEPAKQKWRDQVDGSKLMALS